MALPTAALRKGHTPLSAAAGVEESRWAGVSRWEREGQTGWTVVVMISRREEMDGESRDGVSVSLLGGYCPAQAAPQEEPLSGTRFQSQSCTRGRHRQQQQQQQPSCLSTRWWCTPCHESFHDLTFGRFFTKKNEKLKFLWRKFRAGFGSP
jgi:hypothetical protein